MPQGTQALGDGIYLGLGQRVTQPLHLLGELGKRDLTLLAAHLDEMDGDIGCYPIDLLLLLSQQPTNAVRWTFTDEHNTGLTDGAEDDILVARVDGHRIVLNAPAPANSAQRRASSSRRPLDTRVGGPLGTPGHEDHRDHERDRDAEQPDVEHAVKEEPDCETEDDDPEQHPQ